MHNDKKMYSDVISRVTGAFMQLKLCRASKNQETISLLRTKRPPERSLHSTNSRERAERIFVHE